MSFPHKKITLLAFLMLLMPVMAIAQDTGVPDSVIAGNLDGSAIIASPGDTINVPVWVKNDQDVILMYFPIAIDDQYIANYFDGNLFDILNPSSNPHWDEVEFIVALPGYPFVGFTSYPLFSISNVVPPGSWVPFNSNGAWIKLAEFSFEISNDPSLISDTIQIIEGENHIIDGCSFVGVGDEDDYHPRFVGGTIEVVAPAYAYLPGDANMFLGLWPPQVIGNDVTYLVNYFTGATQPCLLDGFYCAADVNGDCQVIGSDITRLQNYFLGGPPPAYCPDYPPLWPTRGDLPPNAPDGWPNCEGALAVKVIPGEPNRK
jgi:hypothetical protein